MLSVLHDLTAIKFTSILSVARREAIDLAKGKISTALLTGNNKLTRPEVHGDTKERTIERTIERTNDEGTKMRTNKQTDKRTHEHTYGWTED